MNTAAPLLALLAAACFGAALIVTQFGLRHASPLVGATVSVTFTLIAWCALSPVLLDLNGWHTMALVVGHALQRPHERGVIPFCTAVRDA